MNSRWLLKSYWEFGDEILWNKKLGSYKSNRMTCFIKILEQFYKGVEPYGKFLLCSSSNYCAFPMLHPNFQFPMCFQFIDLVCYISIFSYTCVPGCSNPGKATKLCSLVLYLQFVIAYGWASRLEIKHLSANMPTTVYWP